MSTGEERPAPPEGEHEDPTEEFRGTAAEGPSLGETLRQLVQTAQETAREVTDTARPHVAQAAKRAGDEARRAAEAAQPHAEELSRRARGAMRAARPVAEQALRDTARYTREHEEELRRAAAAGASAAARVATPPHLRPALDAFERGLRAGDEAPAGRTPAEGSEEGGEADAAAGAPEEHSERR